MKKFVVALMLLLTGCGYTVYNPRVYYWTSHGMVTGYTGNRCTGYSEEEAWNFMCKKLVTQDMGKLVMNVIEVEKKFPIASYWKKMDYKKVGKIYECEVEYAIPSACAIRIHEEVAKAVKFVEQFKTDRGKVYALNEYFKTHFKLAPPYEDEWKMLSLYWETTWEIRMHG